MPRMARVVAEGVPHHITQRGNNRQDVFLLAEDRRFYLETLRARCRDHDVALLGYCLMTNHVHLVAVPSHANSLALALGRCHGSYARRFNRRYRRSGHLWQNRFYSCVLGGSHVAAALAYVDLNPVRAGLVRRPEEWEWSSARAHAGVVRSDESLDADKWNELGLGEDWPSVLTAHGGEAQAAELREATYGGRPLGDEEFIAALEAKADRLLRRQTPGPKPKPKPRSEAAHA